MENESMEVLPNEENGNVPVEDNVPATPSSEVTPSTEVVAEATEVVTPETPTVTVESELFELPDGRQVDAATLAREFKENFLPEFTRKSQELARLTTPETPLPETKPANKFQDPTYIPESYAEIIEAAREETLRTMQEQQQNQVNAQKAVEDAVTAQLTQIKTTDPALNENALFSHAVKYGFTDLVKAHQNMKDMSETIKKVQTTTAQNIAKRADPVSVTPGAQAGVTLNPDDYASPRDYVRALNAQGGGK